MNGISDKTTIPISWAIALIGAILAGSVTVAKEAISIDSRLTAIETRMADLESRK